MSNLISKPTKAYLERAAIPSVKLNKAQKQQQLLILDLNGTLVSRNRKNRSMYVRPYSKQFFEYIFENFYVMLWSSAQPHSVRNMCRLFGANQEKIKVIWDRTKFGLTQKDYNRKVATIKDLDKVWKYFDEQHPEQHFDQTNTILLDDSPKKAQLQPYNCVHPSEFEHTSPTFISSGDSELLHIMNYLKLLQFQSNVSNFIREQPYNTLENDKSNNEKLWI
ncbi:NLI interacting factor-like phosphatase-domain-containing protein [Mycotypha africana]|uniref:NLI interacting factor-like phosphatase-domain-containing protein n=1 Tax=Mycotypha africana TaxID=64632 RepID=UPI002301CB8A|nr:NLI interacting factor-like phosphatase-domain-containing protein [Mycotypha africana]KAI8991815.1 NLI interacting factor-like phosphatase-domain-containing protein [Mycotypha africana]